MANIHIYSLFNKFPKAKKTDTARSVPTHHIPLGFPKTTLNTLPPIHTAEHQNKVFVDFIFGRLFH
jgi:hypothetical protein